MVRLGAGALVLVAVFALSACDKGERDGQGPGANPEQAASAGVDGAALYGERCASCHGDTGLGDGPSGRVVEAANLTTAEMQERLSDAQIADIVRNGRGRMQPSGVSDDAEIRALVERVRGLRQ